MATDISKLGLKVPWQDVTDGMTINAAGTSKEFQTGQWSTEKPYVDEEKCKQCLLCAPACPDSCIPVADGVRGTFDWKHCKGCGICAKVCPFHAIEMKGEE